MTDKEKAQKLDMLINLATRIRGTYGSADKVFCTHEEDKKRAKMILQDAIKNNITLTEIVALYTLSLYNKGCEREHITKQLKKVNDFYNEL